MGLLPCLFVGTFQAVVSVLVLLEPWEHTDYLITVLYLLLVYICVISHSTLFR